MLLIHFIVVIFVIIAFSFVIQHFSSLYISSKLHNRGVDKKSADMIAGEMSLLTAIFFGILTFVFICIAISTFSGGVII